MPLDLRAFLNDFRVEAADYLRAFDEQLLVLEKDPTNPQPIRAMFLAAHSIKGGAAMLDLGEVRDLAHAAEDVLGALRDGSQTLDPNGADLLFRTVDQLRDLVARAECGATDPPAPATLALVAALRVQTDQPRPCVLLVDDSATVRLVQSMLLEDAGFEVDAVADGAQALEHAHSRTYSLIVAGVGIAGPGNSDMAEVVRLQTTPLILTTIDGEPDESLSALPHVVKGTLSDLSLALAARAATTSQ